MRMSLCLPLVMASSNSPPASIADRCKRLFSLVQHHFYPLSPTTTMKRHQRARKSRRRPEPHFSRCDSVVASGIDDKQDTREDTSSDPTKPASAKRQRTSAPTCDEIPSAPTEQLPDIPSPPVIDSGPGDLRLLDPTASGTSSDIPRVSDENHPTAQVDNVEPPSVNANASRQTSPSTSPRTSTPTCHEEDSSDDVPDQVEFITPDCDMLADILPPGAFDAFQAMQYNGGLEEELHQESFTSDRSDLANHVVHDSPECTEELSAALLVLADMKKFMRRPTMLGISSMYGKARLTLEGYEQCVAVHKDGDPENPLPGPTTMRQRIFPKLLKDHFVPSSVRNFTQLNTSASQPLPRLSVQAKASSRKKGEAVVVLPSDWARLDIRSLHVVRELACIQKCTCKITPHASDIRIETTRSVTDQSGISRKSDYLWTNNNGTPSPAISGSSVRLFFSTEPSDHPSFAQVRPERTTFRGDVCYSLKATVLSTEHVIHNCTDNHPVPATIEHGLSPSNLTFRQHSMYAEAIPLLKKLCAQSEDQASAPDVLDGIQRNDRNEDLSNIETSTQVSNSQSQLLPGDHLSLLSIEDPNTIAVLVSRFWVRRLSDERNFVLLLSFNSTNDVHMTRLSTIGAPDLLDSGSAHSPASSSGAKCFTTGKLPSGKRYYKYRILLYADDFTPRSTLFPKGSVGGFYMSPSGFSLRSKKNQSTIRTISLTPKGISTNMVFDFIISDIVNGCVKGIECVDAYGEQVIIFLEVTGFVADYPASTSAIDVRGHMASSPCTHCTFPRQVLVGSSMFAYTTVFHSGHTAFRRTQSRSFSVRSFGLSKKVGKNLGMKLYESSSESELRGKRPLLKLASSFNEALYYDNDNNSILDLHKMDGYEANIIAAEHLITGLFKELFALCFIHISDESARQKLTAILCSQLQEHSFQTQTALFKKKKLVPGLTMSMLYCILTALPSSLGAIGLLDTIPIKQMLLQLWRFASLAFWTPSFDSDGYLAWSFVHGEDKALYHNLLQRIAANFTKGVHRYSKSHPSLIKNIDRPNVHRLLELAIHTIPNYSHVSFICELVFEAAHQPLKFFLSRNHSADSHIHAVHSILAKDWLVRLWCLWSIHTNPHEPDSEKRYALFGLIRLLAGPKADKVNWNSASVATVLTGLRDNVHSILQGTVEQRLRKWYSEYACMQHGESKWVLGSPLKSTSQTDVQRSLYSTVLQAFCSLSLEKPDELQLHDSVLFQRGYGPKTVRSHERLQIGDVVQVLLPADFEGHKFLHDIQSPIGTPSFFVVGAVLLVAKKKPWVYLTHCTKLSKLLDRQVPDFSEEPLMRVSTQNLYAQPVLSGYFLRLNNSVKKVGVMHDCSTGQGCTLSPDKKRMEHSATTVTGGTFFLLTRCMGYPARRS